MPFLPKAGVKLNLKTAPISYSRSSKWAPNGPKHLKMAPKAPKGPHQYSMVILCPNIHDLGPFRPFYIAKKMRNRLKMDSIILP